MRRRLVGLLVLAVALMPVVPAAATSVNDVPGRSSPVSAVGTSWLVSASDPSTVSAAEDRLTAASLPVRSLSDRVMAVDAARGELDAALGGLGVTIEPDAVVAPASSPTEAELFPDQWALRNLGGLPDSVAGVDVRAVDAWQYTTGAGATIAVVDGRLGLLLPPGGHPDLAPGRVRESVLPGDPSSTPCTAPTRASHGVQVATVAAANGAMVGMAPDARLLSVPFMDDCGAGSIADGIAAMHRAAASGADVIVASWGRDGMGSSGPNTDAQLVSLQRAIEDIAVPVVAAAGNAARDVTDPRLGFAPASLQVRNLLAVASVTSAGELAPSSNHSRSTVDLAAPGDRVLTGLRTGTAASSYGISSGTSFAAPHVAGAIALARSVPSVLTSDAIIDVVRDTARPLPSLADKVTTGGMLDAGALVAAVADGGACPVTQVPEAGFGDVAPSNAHRLAIDCLVWREVAGGRGPATYAPSATVTRGQMATFLAGILDQAGRVPEAAPDAFEDDDGNTHEAAIDALAALGIVQGVAPGRFAPQAPVTRAQMATFLANTVRELASAPLPAAPRSFDDTVGSVHAANADLLRELGIASGVAPRRFEPARELRRDQMASFVARTLDRAVRDGVAQP